MKIVRSLLPILIGLAVTCSVFFLLAPRITHADPAALIQTTVDDFNKGSFYRTGMTRDFDGEITLLRSGIAGEWLTNINAAGFVPRYGHAAIVVQQSHLRVWRAHRRQLAALDSICPDQHADSQFEQLDHVEREPANGYLHFYGGERLDGCGVSFGGAAEWASLFTGWREWRSSPPLLGGGFCHVKLSDG